MGFAASLAAGLASARPTRHDEVAHREFGAAFGFGLDLSLGPRSRLHHRLLGSLIATPPDIVAKQSNAVEVRRSAVLQEREPLPWGRVAGQLGRNMGECALKPLLNSLKAT